MVMSYIFTVLVAVAVIFSLLLGNGNQLSQSVLEGAQSGVQLVISIAGSVCLWTGVGNLMEKTGITKKLAKLFRPILGRIFPSFGKHSAAGDYISANVCANLLGLGNAATPMGIQAAQCLKDPARPDVATDELCRLVVLNTASIQLIPANVSAVRSSLGCTTPFDILPCVWLTSICSAGLGLGAAFLLGKLWKK